MGPACVPDWVLGKAAAAAGGVGAETLERGVDLGRGFAVCDSPISARRLISNLLQRLTKSAMVVGSWEIDAVTKSLLRR